MNTTTTPTPAARPARRQRGRGRVPDRSTRVPPRRGF
jgi:hypothetical protein